MASEKPKIKKNQSVTISALLMSAGTFFSRILGFVRDAVVAALFDRTVTDVFAAAFALPNFFRRLLGEGSLSVAFIPVYVDRINSDEQAAGQGRAQGLANAVFSLVMLASLVICAACFIGMEDLLMFWLGEEEFLKVPGKFDLAVKLSRITIFYLFLVTGYAYFMAVAQAWNRFFVPALAPALFNFFFILTVFLPDSVFGVSAEKLAWAVILGGVAQTAMVAVLLYKMGVLPRPTMKINLPGVKTIGLNMAPGILGLAASQLMNIMNQKFAAGLEEGAMTYVYYTNRLLELPQSLIAISIGTALLPTLSRFHAQGDMTSFQRTSEEQIKLFWFLALPSAVGLFFLSTPIVELLFQRGRWGAEDTLVVSLLVQIISLQLLFSGTSRILIPGFYAMKNTLIPALMTTVIVTFHIVLAPILMAKYGVQGLVGSVVVTGAVGLLGVALVHRRFVVKLSYLSLLGHVLKFLPGAGLIACLCAFAYEPFDSSIKSWLGSGVLVSLMSLFTIIAISGVVYFGIGHLLGLPESQKVTRRFIKS
ncbi:MAG: murein biosynthesis integral membrane protein MurJ [Bdellovibrionales bacterium]|nr:murein biosynthesis integral membrane protein MurJ [Bdellovibrionales bacterium]